MIVPTSFAIHVTYTCPLTCASCCFSSGPTNKDKLSIATIHDTIEALNPDHIKMIAFTGGEPFLLGKDLDSVVRAANSRGFRTRIVTSAYWAKYKSLATLRMTELKACGLDELSVSWDDFHEEQESIKVTFKHVANAFFACREVGVTCAVNVVQGRTSRWTAARVRDELGLPLDSNEVVVESPLNLTGRAEAELTNLGPRNLRTLGPCPYVVSGPTLSAKGKLLACCGVIQECEPLVLDHQYSPSTVQERIEGARSSPLLNAIYMRGPYEILKWVAEATDNEVPSPSEVGGNCEACRILFHDQRFAPHVDSVIQERAERIAGEASVLSAIGLLADAEIGARGVLSLWVDRSALMDVSPMSGNVDTQNAVSVDA